MLSLHYTNNLAVFTFGNTPSPPGITECLSRSRSVAPEVKQDPVLKKHTLPYAAPGYNVYSYRKTSAHVLGIRVGAGRDVVGMKLSS